ACHGGPARPALPQGGRFSRRGGHSQGGASGAAWCAAPASTRSAVRGSRRALCLRGPSRAALAAGEGDRPRGLSGQRPWERADTRGGWGRGGRVKSFRLSPFRTAVAARARIREMGWPLPLYRAKPQNIRKVSQSRPHGPLVVIALYTVYMALFAMPFDD